ncbi:MAG: WD40/YVTN/BNR-like repeat-containing protein, partial [Pirellulaceae bacterium]
FTFYVATASGGVWKTINEGTTWTPIFDYAPSGSVGAIATCPTNPETVWVGLGEANIFRSSMSGTGIYRSEDGGESWQHMGLADSQHIARIVLHPTNPDVVYVAASGHEYTPNEERGIYRTTDGGETWERQLFIDSHIGAIDIVMDPSDPQTLFAAMWNRTRHAWSDPVPGPDDGIFKSTDGGETWTILTKGLPNYEETGRIGLAMSPASPDVVYALFDNHEIARTAEEGERDNYGRNRQDVIKGAEIYRSDDKGETWQLMSEGDRAMSRVFATYGWVFGQVRVDPNDVDTVYVMGVPLLKSTDGGKSFKRVNYAGLHGDHHAMWIDPNNSDYIINGNDGGINFSYDGGATWKNVQNLPVVQFYNVEVDNAKPFRAYGSIQDNNSWRGPSNYRAGRSSLNAWERIPGGEASTMAIDPNDENIFYSEGFYGNIQRSTFDPSKTERIRPQVAEGETPLRGQWLAPFILSPHNSHVIYHGMQYVFRSMDQGQTWERISDDLTFNDPDRQGNIPFATLTALSESPLKFGVVYAGTDDGRLHMTRDGGHTWQEIMDGLPRKWVSRVVASAHDEGTVYVTLNGKRDNDFQVYVYRSDDFGQSWTDISSGIPGGPVNVVFEDPTYDDLLYVGTDLGVYVTMDDGQSWHVLGSELPNTFVHDLALQPRDKTLVAATHGRGMYTLKLRSLYSAYRDRYGIEDEEKEEATGEEPAEDANERSDDEDDNEEDDGRP